MTIRLHLHHAAPPAAPPLDADDDAIDSHRPHVAAMFGLGLDDDAPTAVIPPTDLTLEPGQVIFVTGPSGSGKSTLLRLIDQHLANRGHPPGHRIRFDALPPLPDRSLVDCFDAPLPRVLRALSLAGLGDAFVMLRRPRELSDGQRYRLHLAQTILAVEAANQTRQTSAAATRRWAPGAEALPCPGVGERDDPAGDLPATRDAPPLCVVLADEFGATLDRLTATVLARNLRKWVSAAEVCLVAATTHDDLLEPLEPNVLVHKPLGAAIEVLHRRRPPTAPLQGPASTPAAFEPAAPESAAPESAAPEPAASRAASATDRSRRHD